MLPATVRVRAGWYLQLDHLRRLFAARPYIYRVNDAHRRTYFANQPLDFIGWRWILDLLALDQHNQPCLQING